MKKSLIIFAALLAGGATAYINAEKSIKQNRKEQQMVQKALELPDSLFEGVKIEDLLDDEVYLKLAHDGWSPREISAIMNTALTDKAKAKLKGGYGFYAKQWRPAYGRSLGDDSLYNFVDTTFTKAMIASIEETVPAYDLNTYWPLKVYSPQDRKDGKRDPGYFRAVPFNPSSGRIRHIVANDADKDGNQLYVIADGAGIFKTDDCGKTWDCITDRIPDRINRSQVPSYSLPVDPDNWDHLFAFVDNKAIYETENGGESWTRVANAVSKDFKRCYGFKSSKDPEDNVKFIGATIAGNRMNNELYISEDKGVTWTKVNVPEEFMETNSQGTGYWFQQIYFHPDRNIIYLPGSRSILYLDNGGRKGDDGAYHLQRMSFAVKDQDGNQIDGLENVSQFPFPGDGAGHMVIDPNEPNRMWYALGKREECKTALFRTDDGGQTWITLHNELPLDENGNLITAKDANGNTVPAAIGKGRMFGNEVAYSWLGGFGVNLQNPNLMYGCSMSSAKSHDGGKNWTEFAWGTRIKSQVRQADGSLSSQYYEVSASRHNADNHTIVSHPSGRVFRGSDGGMFMIDPNINGGEWTNIGSNMGQMLFYNIRTNEFGDQAIIGNTQDIDVQTYRYGRWGNWRGYEGSESSFNPFSNTEYFSGGNGGGLDGMSFDSWHTARNYADVRTGSWYMLRTWSGNSNPSTLYRIDDIGGSVVDLYSGINNRIVGIAMARDKNTTTIYATTADGYFHVSTDNGKLFTPLQVKGVNAKFSNTKLAVDPNDSRYIYLGQNGGKVFKWDTETGLFPAMNEGLPSINCDRLLFHEGSGDLYFVSYSNGIYIREKGSNTWRFWTKGYNPASFTDCDINYTTQEMVLADYGRGVWVADLEHPSDRYFGTDNPLRLKEYANVNGRRTIGIDTDWVIPMYYNYTWTVTRGDQKLNIDNPYQFLVYPLQNGDKVKLELTLRESPDVHTVSQEFTVVDTEETTVERHSGNAMYSAGNGRIDIGWMDWFEKDFTVDFWVKPESDGVIIANRQREVNPDLKGAKGWMLYIDGGKLKFSYSPTNYFTQPTYEATEHQTETIEWGGIQYGEWSHIAVVQQRNDSIAVYCNGLPHKAARIKRDHSLNNSVCLSLFGDINERNCLKGTIDELKIWNRALKVEELRAQIHATNLSEEDGPVAYYNFNTDTLSNDRELMTGYKPLTRVKATPQYSRMTVPVSADDLFYDKLGSSNVKFGNDNVTLLEIQTQEATNSTTYVYGFDAERWADENDNLDDRYYTPSALGYVIKAFDLDNPYVSTDFTFHNGKAGNFESDRSYRLYVADLGKEKTWWKAYGDNMKAENGKIVLRDVPMRDLLDKRLLIVALNPALELTIEGMTPDGNIEIYEEDKDKYNITLKAVEGQKAPTEKYALNSSSGIIDTPDVEFHEGVASDQIRVELDYLGDFNNHISTVISGETDDLIPLPVEVVNKITPQELGNSVSITKGGLVVNNVQQFSPLTGSQNMTFMGWVRIDDPTVLTTGRNNDGCAPLIFFRLNGTGYCGGLHFNRTAQGSNQSVLSCHWNDKNQGVIDKSPLKVSTDDVGKWMHVALAVRPDSLIYYLNGMKFGVKTTVNPSNIKSALMLGQNVQGNRWFSGAFDHVAIWNRTLSDEEIRKYMQQRVLLDDKDLLSYITMDHFDESGKIYDLVSGASLIEYGDIAKNQASTVPFKPVENLLPLTNNEYLSLNTGAKGVVSVFDGSPYNFLSTENTAKYYPLNQEYYTVIFDAMNSNQGVSTLTYSHPSILNGDHIAVGIRQLGDPNPTNNFFDSKASKDGQISFEIPAGMLNSSSELGFMLYLEENTGRRPLIVSFDKNNGVKDGDMIKITSTTDLTRDLYLNVESANKDDEVYLSVKETNYASVSSDPITLKTGRVTTKVTIDPQKIDKFALNPVTISANTNVEGVVIEPITFYVYLEPLVQLSLKNGTNGSPDRIVTDDPYPVIEVEAELIEGYLVEDVKLEFTPGDLAHSMNLSQGSLLSTQGQNNDRLEYYNTEAESSVDKGWNFIGNPYLSNINLTKDQNREFDEKLVAPFVYHTHPGFDNFFAYDLEDAYDINHRISPFQPFFVQTMGEKAWFKVTEIAKEKSLSRKTFDFYEASKDKVIELTLYCDDVETDRTVIRWRDNGDQGYDILEDAPKMWARQEGVSSIYSLALGLKEPEQEVPSETPLAAPKRRIEELTSQETPLSINTVSSQSTQYVDLVLNVDPSVSDVKVVASKMSGFDPDNDVVYFNDMTRFEREKARPDEVFAIVDPNNRHTVSIEYNDGTGIKVNQADKPDYKVTTRHGECTVSGLMGNAEILVYNLSGILMKHQTTTAPEITFYLPDDIYIVKIVENGKEFISKIIVK